MRIDSEMLDSASARCSARTYAWDGPWISLGRFQKDFVSEDGCPTVRRPTGGRAVRHGDDLTVAIAVDLNCLGLDSRRVAEIYRHLVIPLCAGFEAIGQPVMPVSQREAAGDETDCFRVRSGFDLVSLQGVKRCGVALRVSGTAVLLQASMPGILDQRAAWTDGFIRGGADLGWEWKIDS